MSELQFPQERVRPLIERISENGVPRLKKYAHGWWETEESGFILLVSWNNIQDDIWEFYLRWEKDGTEGGRGLLRVQAEDHEQALLKIKPGIKAVLETSGRVTNECLNGNGYANGNGKNGSNGNGRVAE